MKLFLAFKHYIRKHPTELAYKPTSDSYDANKLKEVLVKIHKSKPEVTEEEMQKVFDFIDVTTYLHNLYEEFYAVVQSRLADFNLKGEDIIEYFIAMFNNEHKTVYEKIIEASRKRPQGLYLYQDMVNQKLKTPDGAKLDVKAMMEGATDATSILCNFMRFHLTEEYENKEAKPEYFTSMVRDLFQMADIMATFKHSYDDVLYDHTFVKMDTVHQTIAFDFENHKNEKIKALGHMILEERIFHVDCQLREKGIKSSIERYVTNYRVKRIHVNNGFVTLEFGYGDPKHHKEIAQEIQAAIDAYYEFLDLNMELTGLRGINVAEMLSVWVALQYICREVTEHVRLDKYNVIYTKEEMDGIPRKFRIIDLVGYLTKLTGLRENIITLVLEALTVDWEKYNNIWTSPLYKIKDYYCLPFYPIINSMPYNIIENMLQKGGYGLDQRGYDFEQYVYHQIADVKHEYGLVCKAASRYGSKKEEIDLLIALRDVVVIAEVKCIHYSMSPQNYGDACDRLEKGAEQALKKAEYMRKHPELFEDLGDVNKKKIIPVVLTNYPIFSGLEYTGVYVIDSHSFISYFNAGYITMREMSMTANTIRKVKFFYNNETEYSSKFEGYLQDGPVKKIHMSKVEIVETQLLPQIKPWKCTAKTALYNGDSGFDISNNPN